MATTSRVPAAVDALLAVLGAAPGLADVRVIDGPATVNFTERQRVYVGWQRGDAFAVELTQDFNAAGARTRDEAFAIHCYAEARGGDKDMGLLRRRVFDIVAQVEQALRATDANPEAPTLMGTVLWAHITAGDLSQFTKDGTVAGLAFTVTCQARI